jgi:hypothetical protein
MMFLKFIFNSRLGPDQRVRDVPRNGAAGHRGIAASRGGRDLRSVGVLRARTAQGTPGAFGGSGLRAEECRGVRPSRDRHVRDARLASADLHDLRVRWSGVRAGAAARLHTPDPRVDARLPPARMAGQGHRRGRRPKTDRGLPPHGRPRLHSARDDAALPRRGRDPASVCQRQGRPRCPPCSPDRAVHDRRGARSLTPTGTILSLRRAAYSAAVSPDRTSSILGNRGK